MKTVFRRIGKEVDYDGYVKSKSSASPGDLCSID